MREILFRGKRVDNGGWVEGYYVYDESEQITEKPIAYIYHLNPHPCGWTIIPYVVDLSTVGQYTGLTDKNENGTKIFEGDIISIPFEEDRSPWEENCIYYENGEVYFSAEHHGWYVRFWDNETLSLWEYDELDVEIIGNIHDNPELIGGKQ